MGVLANRVRVNTTTTGTGTITLGSAVAGYQTFTAGGITDGQVVSYVIVDVGNAWEIGDGTFTLAANTMTRSVTESSNSDAALSLSGAAQVFISPKATEIGINNVSGTSGSSVTTSGTEVIVTGIPSGVTRVTVIISFVSTNGTAPVEVRIGDSGGISASGYIGTSALQINASATTDVSSSTGFSLGGNSAAVGYNGFLTLEGLGGTSWYASYTLRSAVGEVVTGSGVESLSGTLDRISIATDGVDTFDNGFVEVKWSY